MNQTPKNFWEAAFTPSKYYMGIFIAVLLVTTLGGNLLYSLIVDSESVSGTEIIVVTSIILILGFGAYYSFFRRPIISIPFSVSDTKRLTPCQAIIVTPSNPDAIKKIVSYHEPKLEHIWFVGDTKAQEHGNKFKEDYQGQVHLHIVETPINSNVHISIPDYQKAVYEALQLGIPQQSIVVDITGGKKTMSIAAFLVGLATGVKISYLDSTYTTTRDPNNPNLERQDDSYQYIEIDVTRLPIRFDFDTESLSNMS